MDYFRASHHSSKLIKFFPFLAGNRWRYFTNFIYYLATMGQVLLLHEHCLLWKPCFHKKTIDCVCLWIFERRRTNRRRVRLEGTTKIHVVFILEKSFIRIEIRQELREEFVTWRDIVTASVVLRSRSVWSRNRMPNLTVFWRKWSHMFFDFHTS